MPRKPRVEYSGAVYHVMCRGNGGQAIFADDLDRGMFLDVLDEVCERCGWRIHAYVLMGNHYHVLLETPEPNLVAGMKWLQGTYTQRYNARHRRWGHLFQGRYKALPVHAEEVDLHDERKAESLLQAGLKVLKLDESVVVSGSKSSDEKCLLAWLLRRHTAIPNAWIACRLNMGRADCLSRYPKRIDATEDPHLLKQRERLATITRIRD